MNSVGGVTASAAPRILLASLSGSYGGMEIRMRQDAVLLRDQHWTPMVSTPRFRERAEFHLSLSREGIPLLDVPYPYLLENWRLRHAFVLKARLLTLPALRRLRLDFAHVFLPWGTYGLGMLWALSRLGVPSIVSVHNAFPEKRLSTWHQTRVREAFSTTQRVIAVSESALDRFLNVFRPYLSTASQTEVIPNPVDTARFVPDSPARSRLRENLGIPPKAFVIGSVGRLDEQKCPTRLIQVLSMLHEAGHRCYLVLVGQGPLEQELRALAKRMGIDHYVRFTGYVRETETVYPGFDLHLLLSRNEGFGLVTAEAMACGVPAVASDVPGSRDVLQGLSGGILLDGQDLDSVARTIDRLIRDERQLHCMRQCAPREIRERYGKERVEERILAVYSAGLRGLGPNEC